MLLQHLCMRFSTLIPMDLFVRMHRTWACYPRCDGALETESEVETDEVIHDSLEVMYGKQLVTRSYMVWEALNKVVEKDDIILSIVMDWFRL